MIFSKFKKLTLYAKYTADLKIILYSSEQNKGIKLFQHGHDRSIQQFLLATMPKTSCSLGLLYIFLNWFLWALWFLSGTFFSLTRKIKVANEDIGSVQLAYKLCPIVKPFDVENFRSSILWVWFPPIISFPILIFHYWSKL